MPELLKQNLDNLDVYDRDRRTNIINCCVGLQKSEAEAVNIPDAARPNLSVSRTMTEAWKQ